MEFSELQQLVESNARAIQAQADNQATSRLDHEEMFRRADEERAELRNAMLRLADVQEDVNRILNSLNQQ